MFSDILDSWLTRVPPAVRAMGYFREIQGIRGRAARCQADWTEHLRRTRETILQGADRCDQRRKAIVIGGGLVHDVPLAELADRFREVILVDLVHPWSARRATRQWPNVRRVALDITGTIDEAYCLAWDGHLPLPISEPRFFLDDPELDFTASVNVLSQLPCMPMEYLRREAAHAPAKIEDYARQLIQAHTEYLARLPGRVTLVTDYERIKLNLMGLVVETRDLFFGVRLPKWGEEWEWRLAPCPEADPKHHYYRKVVGIADWK